MKTNEGPEGFKHLLVSSVTMMARVGLMYKNVINITGVLVFEVDQDTAIIVDVKERIEDKGKTQKPHDSDNSNRAQPNRRRSQSSDSASEHDEPPSRAHKRLRMELEDAIVIKDEPPSQDPVSKAVVSPVRQSQNKQFVVQAPVSTQHMPARHPNPATRGQRKVAQVRAHAPRLRAPRSASGGYPLQRQQYHPRQAFTALQSQNFGAMMGNRAAPPQLWSVPATHQGPQPHVTVGPTVQQVLMTNQATSGAQANTWQVPGCMSHPVLTQPVPAYTQIVPTPVIAPSSAVVQPVQHSAPASRTVQVPTPAPAPGPAVIQPVLSPVLSPPATLTSVQAPVSGMIQPVSSPVFSGGTPSTRPAPTPGPALLHPGSSVAPSGGITLTSATLHESPLLSPQSLVPEVKDEATITQSSVLPVTPVFAEQQSPPPSAQQVVLSPRVMHPVPGGIQPVCVQPGQPALLSAPDVRSPTDGTSQSCISEQPSPAVAGIAAVSSPPQHPEPPETGQQESAVTNSEIEQMDPSPTDSLPDLDEDYTDAVTKQRVDEQSASENRSVNDQLEDSSDTIAYDGYQDAVHDVASGLEKERKGELPQQVGRPWYYQSAHTQQSGQPFGMSGTAQQLLKPPEQPAFESNRRMTEHPEFLDLQQKLKALDMESSQRSQPVSVEQSKTLVWKESSDTLASGSSSSQNLYLQNSGSQSSQKTQGPAPKLLSELRKRLGTKPKSPQQNMPQGPGFHPSLPDESGGIRSFSAPPSEGFQLPLNCGISQISTSTLHAVPSQKQQEEKVTGRSEAEAPEDAEPASPASSISHHDEPEHRYSETSEQGTYLKLPILSPMLKMWLSKKETSQAEFTLPDEFAARQVYLVASAKKRENIDETRNERFRSHSAPYVKILPQHAPPDHDDTTRVQQVVVQKRMPNVTALQAPLRPPVPKSNRAINGQDQQPDVVEPQIEELPDDAEKLTEEPMAVEDRRCTSLGANSHSRMPEGFLPQVFAPSEASDDKVEDEEEELASCSPDWMGGDDDDQDVDYCLSTRLPNEKKTQKTPKPPARRKPKMFGCSLCKKAYVSQKSLQRHFNTLHSPSLPSQATPVAPGLNEDEEDDVPLGLRVGPKTDADAGC